MTIYRRLMLGRAPHNAVKVDKALRALTGLKSLHLNDGENTCYLCIESELDSRALFDLVEAALSRTECTVVLMSVENVYEEIKKHFFVASYRVDRNVEVGYAFNLALEKKYGAGYELSCPTIKDVDDFRNAYRLPGKMVLVIQSIQSVSVLMGELETIGSRWGLQFDLLLDHATPDPKPKNNPKPALKTALLKKGSPKPKNTPKPTRKTAPVKKGSPKR